MEESVGKQQERRGGRLQLGREQLTDVLSDRRCHWSMRISLNNILMRWFRLLCGEKLSKSGQKQGMSLGGCVQ